MHPVIPGGRLQGVFGGALGLAVGARRRRGPVFVDARIQRLAHRLDAGKKHETPHPGAPRRLGQRPRTLEVDLPVAGRLIGTERPEGMGVAGAVEHRVDALAGPRQAVRVGQLAADFVGARHITPGQHPQRDTIRPQRGDQPGADEAAPTGDEAAAERQNASRRRQ